MSESTRQTLNVVGCTPGPSGIGKTRKPWALFYLEVQDADGNQLEGKYKTWNQPLEPGLAEYEIETTDDANYGRSYTLKAVGPAGAAQATERPQTSSQDPPANPPDRLLRLEKVVSIVARRVDKTEERVTVLATLVEAIKPPSPAAARFGDDEDIPF